MQSHTIRDNCEHAEGTPTDVPPLQFLGIFFRRKTDCNPAPPPT